MLELLSVREVLQGVYCLAISTYLEMQHDIGSVRVPHPCDRFPRIDVTAFLNQARFIVRVGTEERVIVLNDNKLTVASQSTSAIHHRTAGGGLHRLPSAAADVDALGG